MMLKYSLLSAIIATSAFVAGDAAAVTLTNRDSVEHRVQITEGEAEDVIQNVVMSANETRDDLCQSGCMMTIDSGYEELFDGNEIIYIQEDNFVIAD